MSTQRARVVLRYLPASDVLSGVIELGTLAADQSTVESPNADTHLEWRQGIEINGPLLSAFQLVHASALLESDHAPDLPTMVLDLARQLIRSGRGALRPGASAIEQLQARATTESALPLAQLLRPRSTGVTDAMQSRPLPSATSAPRALRMPALLPPSARAEHSDDSTMLAPPATASVDIHPARRDAMALAAALREFATATALLNDRDDDLHRTDTLVRLLRELASVLADGDGHTASPGTTAAARRAIRGGLPLGDTERRRLRWALHAVDERSAWDDAAIELQSLADDLRHAGQPVDRRSSSEHVRRRALQTPRADGGHRPPRAGGPE